MVPSIAGGCSANRQATGLAGGTVAAGERRPEYENKWGVMGTGRVAAGLSDLVSLAGCCFASGLHGIQIGLRPA